MENFKKENFKFKKEFGQNFIFDKNFLTAVVRDFDLDKNTNVVEIGAGAGTLSCTLAQNFKRVVSFEIDKTLTEHLTNLSNEYDNLTFEFVDILKKDTKDIEKLFGTEKYVIIANLPYYITSQIVFKFLFESKKLTSMFVMVQKEVGERYCAKPSTKEYGIPTVLLSTFANCKIVKNVSKKMFTPMPKIDSCIIKIELDNKKFEIENIEKYQKFVSSSFKTRRKTLYNNLSSSGYVRENIVSALEKLELRVDVRPENLTAKNFVDLFNLLNRR